MGLLRRQCGYFSDTISRVSFGSDKNCRGFDTSQEAGSTHTVLEIKRLRSRLANPTGKEEKRKSRGSGSRDMISKQASITNAVHIYVYIYI